MIIKDRGQLENNYLNMIKLRSVRLNKVKIDNNKKADIN